MNLIRFHNNQMQSKAKQYKQTTVRVIFSSCREREAGSAPQAIARRRRQARPVGELGANDAKKRVRESSCIGGPHETRTRIPGVEGAGVAHGERGASHKALARRQGDGGVTHQGWADRAREHRGLRQCHGAIWHDVACCERTYGVGRSEQTRGRQERGRRIDEIERTRERTG